MDLSDNLALPYIMPSQAQKHVTHNEAIGILDALVQLAVRDRDLAAPPAAPADGDRYIVAASATGDWSGMSGKIAHRLDGAWTFYAPRPGFVAYIADEAAFAHWTGSAWMSLSGALGVLQNLASLGVGTAADGTNPFAAKLNKALWTARSAAEGGDGDLRTTLNKETAGDVLSFLMQTGYSGRAELGLIGDDNLALKVSPDGSAWTTALSVDRASGLAVAHGDPTAPLGLATRQYVVAKAGDTMTGALMLPNGSAAAPGLAVGASGTGLLRDATNHRLGVCVDGVEQGFFNRGGKLALRKRMLMKPDVPRRDHLASGPWIISASPADNLWGGLCWSAELGLFCAVAGNGAGNRAMTSPDGVTWTARTSAADNTWQAVCRSAELGLFCAVANTGTGNRVMTSPDGVTWTIRASAADANWRAIAWSPELALFCAVGVSGAVMTSPDGIAWTTRTAASANSWNGVGWSAELGLFCAVAITGAGNRVMTSPDGSVWTGRTSAADNDWRSVCWSAELGLFAAVGSSGAGNRVMTSPDASTWTSRASAADNDWRSVSWAPEIGLFAAVANTGTGNRAMTSPDGIAWTARSTPADNNWQAGCWSPERGLFCAIATSGTGNRAMTSRSAFSLAYRS